MANDLLGFGGAIGSHSIVVGGRSLFIAGDGYRVNFLKTLKPKLMLRLPIATIAAA